QPGAGLDDLHRALPRIASSFPALRRVDDRLTELEEPVEAALNQNLRLAILARNNQAAIRMRPSPLRRHRQNRVLRRLLPRHRLHAGTARQLARLHAMSDTAVEDRQIVRLVPTL